MSKKKLNSSDTYDHDTNKEFYDYYANESQNKSTQQRLQAMQDKVLGVLSNLNFKTESLQVLDVGCGAGSASILWAKSGYKTHGLDVNEALVDLAKQRANELGVEIDFKVGSATDLPWADQSMDVCLAPELLEHVADWQSCLNEFCRVLKPNGILFLSTSNKLCPKQQEFTLPLYSWYPSFLKRYCEKLAVTTHPEIAGYATYPAVNWFTFFQLKKELKNYGMESFDRFDLIDISKKNVLFEYIVRLIRNNKILRKLAHVFTPYTLIVAIKNNG